MGFLSSIGMCIQLPWKRGTKHYLKSYRICLYGSGSTAPSSTSEIQVEPQGPPSKKDTLRNPWVPL